MFDPGAFAGYEVIGSTQLASAAITTAVVNFSGGPWDHLLFIVRTTGFGTADNTGLRVGTTAGTVLTTGYTQRHLSAAAGAGTFTNTTNQSATQIRLYHNTSTATRLAVVGMTNLPTASKVGWIRNQTATAAAATAGILALGHGELVDTTNRIVCASVVSTGAVNTLNAGSGFVVLGARL